MIYMFEATTVTTFPSKRFRPVIRIDEGNDCYTFAAKETYENEDVAYQAAKTALEKAFDLTGLFAHIAGWERYPH